MGPLVIPLIQAGAMIASQLAGNAAQRQAQKRADEYNRLATDTAYQRELSLLKFQNDFNSPAAQMQRFKDAGLNPNLVYGQGSPGNMLSKPSVPQQAPSRAPQINFQMPDLSALMLQQSQRSLVDTKVEESTVKQDLMRVQTQVAAANPYLKPGFLDAVVSQMVNNAAIKQQETDFKLQPAQGTVNGVPVEMAYTKGWLMMEKELQLLLNKLDAAGTDLKIKAEIFQSKSFQNELLEIQRNWMKNGEITSQHWFQAGFMLLQSLMR